MSGIPNAIITLDTESKNPAGFPDGLPKLPELPSPCDPKLIQGYEYHPKGFRGPAPDGYLCMDKDEERWRVGGGTYPAGDADHYAKIIPVPAKPAVRRFRHVKGFPEVDHIKYDGNCLKSILNNGSELSFGNSIEYVERLVKEGIWIELPAEEPDYSSPEYRKAVMAAWIDGQKIEGRSHKRKEWKHSPESNCWDWKHNDYRIQPAPPKPPEPKRVQLSDDSCVWVQLGETGSVEFVDHAGKSMVVGCLWGKDLSIINSLVSESKGGAL